MNEYIYLELKDLFDITGKELKVSIPPISLMLSAFYCLESEILGEYLEKYGNFINKAREVIFSGSLKIDQLIDMYLIKRGVCIDEMELFHLRHDYVQCYGMYYFGKHFSANMSKIVSKSKELGDFKVSSSVTADPTYAYRRIDDAKECMDAIEAMLKEWGASSSMMSTWVKGQDNINAKSSSRMWYYHEPSLDKSTASRKQKFGNEWLKIGDDSASYPE